MSSAEGRVDLLSRKAANRVAVFEDVLVKVSSSMLNNTLYSSCLVFSDGKLISSVTAMGDERLSYFVGLAPQWYNDSVRCLSVFKVKRPVRTKDELMASVEAGVTLAISSRFLLNSLVVDLMPFAEQPDMGQATSVQSLPPNTVLIRLPEPGGSRAPPDIEAEVLKALAHPEFPELVRRVRSVLQTTKDML